MGAYTALHVGLRHPERCLSVSALGCGWGSSPGEREAAQKSCDAIAELFRDTPIAEAAAAYARFPMRKTFEAKDPRGFAEFEAMLAEHSPEGSIHTMLRLQKLRPTLTDMEEDLKGFPAAAPGASGGRGSSLHRRQHPAQADRAHRRAGDDPARRSHDHHRRARGRECRA